jgi:creatinine amidohydrolase/Fe(II)-dependent formamide hydrolase-like protein
MPSHKFEELAADELTEVLNQTSLVYVPIGTLEFHGVHLPLGMDTIHAYEFCLQATEQTGGVAESSHSTCKEPVKCQAHYQQQ